MQRYNRMNKRLWRFAATTAGNVEIGYILCCSKQQFR